MDQLLKNEPCIDRVVLGANWVWYCALPVYPYEIHGEKFPSLNAQKEALRSLGELIARLNCEGKSVYLVMNTPVSPIQDPKSEIQRGFDCIRILKVDPLKVRDFDELYGVFLANLQSCAQKSGATVIDPRVFFEASGVYPRLINGCHVYKDSCHLRASYVRDHVSYLDETVLR